MPHPNDHHTATQKSFRIITWLLGLVVLVGVIYAVGQQFGSVEQRENRTIDKLMAEWKRSGLPTGLKLKLPADDSLGAQDAAECDIDGQSVLVYQFDPFAPAQVKALDKIKADGFIMHDGQKTKILVNGPFVLADYEDHPDKVEIVEAFKDFGTFEGIEAEQKLETPPK